MPSEKETVDLRSLSDLQQSSESIFDNLPHSLFILDPRGNVLLSNSTPPATLGLSLDEFLQSNIKDLVHEGFFNHSYAAEAAEEKCEKSGLITTKLNFSVMSISTPLLDEKGNVKLVVTTSLPKQLKDRLNHQEELEFDFLRKRKIEYFRTRVLEEDKVIAESKIMRQILLSANAVAQTDCTVLLHGESGTGKEVLAKYIHRHSIRERRPFITVNCAALPEQLVESELFGYEKGAFTGASAQGKPGLIEAAHHGTLFLDEIGELPLSFQAKLLRVVETGQVRRIGGLKDREIDFRLIAATNRNLEQMTREGTFRSDLFYRLNVFPIKIPPLRERREDIIALAMMFFDTFKKKYNRFAQLDPGSLNSLLSHNWPGNVRELRNTIERMVINSLQDQSAEELIEIAASLVKKNPQNDFGGFQGTLKEVLKTVEEKYIMQVLAESGGRLGMTAERLGIYRTSLYRKLKEFAKEKNM